MAAARPPANQPRPKYLDLVRIRLPVPGFVSILHRVSGAALFLFLPVGLCLLQSSLASPEGFDRVRVLVTHQLAKLATLGLAWAFLHHFFAGLRFLALDLHYGTELAAARATSWLVLGASLALTLIVAAWLW